MASRQAIAPGFPLTVYVNETRTAQAIAPTIYINETIATTVVTAEGVTLSMMGVGSIVMLVANAAMSFLNWK